MATHTSLLDRFLGVIESKRPSDRVVLRFLFFIFIGSALWYLISLNNQFTSLTPSRGGELVEGIVGIPRFVNPALAISRADQDVVALLYSGLMKINDEGVLVPDIAESVTVSDDGLVYTVKLRTDRVFHDDNPITAKDVLFTINLIRDPDLKSPLRGNWTDVVLTEISEHELTITLLEAYAPFIENFTVGIMPEHIWSKLPIEQLPFSQYNTEPVGSGLFMINNVNRDASGLISSYSLEAAPSGPLTPNLASIKLVFFQNENLLMAALLAQTVDATVYLPTERIAELPGEAFTIYTYPLPRVFGIFLNQNRSTVLRDKAAREALSAAIDRDLLVETVLDGYGFPTTKPIVNEQRAVLLEYSNLDTVPDISTTTPEEILQAGGWKRNEDNAWEKKIGDSTEILSVTLRTGNSDLFDTTANLIAEQWRDLGVDVQIEQYEQAGLVQSVIRTRDFQTLLFGLDMNRLQDLYPFWHSSQKDDPGLNISQYTNVSVDDLLEEARSTSDPITQWKIITETSDAIAEETPVIFLFGPSLTYIVANDIMTAPISMLGKSADRFMNIEQWHARSELVWPVFR
jgi:peptide/nickel transport system substrate-binding protein